MSIFINIYIYGRSLCMRQNDDKRPSESFVRGVVALVFLVIGYQAAMFVYRASVMKIAANRDEPDTVYVYETPDHADRVTLIKETQKTVGNDVPANRTVRKNSEHAPRAEAVRSTMPRRKVESFRFDPNTADEDMFCRLGFSQKQARSIVNYRNKGGRFRRKEDFAKSFVVSDSIYRRLEPYIDIPLLDLNLADSSAFDALPGIGGWYAMKMMEYRRRLGGYSYKEQLMDIWKFDKEKFDALKDLVTLAPEHMSPYPLWTCSADSLRLHPYIGNYETARAIVLYRENTPKSEWTVEKISAAGIISESAAEKLSRCLIAQP